MDKMMKRFQHVTTQLDQALDGISFGQLEISEEVREQVQMSCKQLISLLLYI